jgi:hypothetical protein
MVAEKELELVKAVEEKQLALVKARAEKESELVKAHVNARDAWADARVLRVEARATKAELENATFRLKAKNLEVLRLLGHSVNLRRAIGKCIQGMARGRACPPVELLSGCLLVLA